MKEEYEHPLAALDVARKFTGRPIPRRPVRVIVGAPELAAGWLLARYLTSVRDRRSAEVARDDPKWAAIRSRLDAPGADQYLHGDEIDKYGEVLRRIESRWPFRLRYWLDGHSLLRRYDQLAAMVQRGRRGWADEDLWGLDTYLCGVAAGAFRQIAELSFGWNNRDWPTHDDWLAELHHLAAKLDQLEAQIGADGSIKGAEDTFDEIASVLRKAVGHLRVD